MKYAQYIPYQELEDRFSRLNKIARQVHPTVWPNILTTVILSGLFALALVGISKSGSGLALLSQGACFVLPIIAVLWIRIRKESVSKAEKRFKKKSQNLLRVWTEQDSATHAIQWQLRLRPKSVAKLRRSDAPGQFIHSSAFHVADTQQNHHSVESDFDLMRRPPSPPQARVGIREYHEPSSDGNQISQPRGFENVSRSQAAVSAVETNQHRRDTPSRPAVVYPPTTSLAIPQATLPSLARSSQRRINNVYSALEYHTMASPTDDHPRSLPTGPTEHRRDRNSRQRLSSAPTGSSTESIWTSWRELLQAVPCFGYMFREAESWMIEISIDEGLLDEFTVPVPSPAYCDYRLPGYEDIIAAPMAPGAARTPTPLGSRGTAAAGLNTLPREIGSPPPAYGNALPRNLEIGNEDTREEEGFVMRHEGNIYRHHTQHTQNGGGQWTMGRSNSGVMNDRNPAAMSTSGTGSYLRPTEMTAVTVSPAPIASLLVPRYGEAVRRRDRGGDREYQQHYHQQHGRIGSTENLPSRPAPALIPGGMVISEAREEQRR
ncbi:hypothetical protein BGZ98_008037 [Dissophora globulifera]|nr:hypothetical protein BGZ98_008037 [Dissophora globulifera]